MTVRLHHLLNLLACLLLMLAPVSGFGSLPISEENEARAASSSERDGETETTSEVSTSLQARRTRQERPLPPARLVGELHGEAPSSHGCSRHAPGPSPCWVRPLRC